MKRLLKNFIQKICSSLYRRRLNVLLWGSVARDHSIAWKLSQSKMLNKLYLANPNDGFKHLGECLNADGYELIKVAKEKNIDLLVVGTEDAQIAGIVDAFNKHGIKTIGMNKYWAQLEASKSFGKDFMIRNSIKTPHYNVISDKDEIESILKEFSLPLVVKNDCISTYMGRGIGVETVFSKEEAKKTIEKFLSKNKTLKKVIVEDFIDGEEISLITLWDGKTLLPLVPVRDYKKLLEGNKGPNTGGLGSYCPVSLINEQNKQIKKYLKQLKSTLIKEKVNCPAILYSGVIFSKNDMYILEYNIRLGDPEGQTLLLHLDSDLLEIFDLMSRKKLHKVKLKWKKGTTACVVVASDGYPDAPKKGEKVENFIHNNVEIFFCGVKKENDDFISCGGRILSVCKNSENPFDEIYETIEKIKFKDKIYRKDIGK